MFGLKVFTNLKLNKSIVKKNKSIARAYPKRPFVGVGVLIFKENQILFANRNQPPNQGAWSIPGGVQELGETIEEAAIREIKEETGLRIELGPIVDVINIITEDVPGDIQFHYTIVDFYADWLSGEAEADDDISDVKWIEIDKLMSTKMSNATRQVAEKAISMRNFLK